MDPSRMQILKFMASTDPRCICRICGYVHDTPIWNGFDELLIRESCICCGALWGRDDRTIELIRKYRHMWLNSGAHWRWPAMKPDNWDLEKQLGNIPKFFR